MESYLDYPFFGGSRVNTNVPKVAPPCLASTFCIVFVGFSRSVPLHEKCGLDVELPDHWDAYASTDNSRREPDKANFQRAAAGKLKTSCVLRLLLSPAQDPVFFSWGGLLFYVVVHSVSPNPYGQKDEHTSQVSRGGKGETSAHASSVTVLLVLANCCACRVGCDALKLKFFGALQSPAGFRF